MAGKDGEKSVTDPVLTNSGTREIAEPSERELLSTLFDLGRQVTSVLNLDELLPRIPQLIARIVTFEAFAIFLFDQKRQELRVAYAVGYPDHVVATLRFGVGEGLVGRAVADRRAFLVNDVSREPFYVEVIPGMQASLVVPLVFKGKAIGALNLLSRNRNQFSESHQALVQQFGTHVAVALENARLFDLERRNANVFETLAEIGKDVASILDLDVLLTRIAKLTRRLMAYRTFGILLLNEETNELEMKLAVKYGEEVEIPKLKLGAGLVGYAALHKEAILAPDVSKDPRYIRVVDDVRSELAIPLMVKDRCIGVFDLESPELDAFEKRDVELLTLLASQAAVAIENARLYEKVRDNEIRLDKEVRFAQRVQAAFLPGELPVRLKGVDVAARFAPARELGGDFYDFLLPEPHGLVVAVGDVSGKGVAAALYGASAGELLRSRTFRRRYTLDRSSPAGVLASMNTILHQRQLEEYYCVLCYAMFDLKRRTVVLSNSGLPYPIRCSGDGCEQITLPGVPLGSLPDSTYDEVQFSLKAGDLFVIATDGAIEAMDATSAEFGAQRLLSVIGRTRDRTAREVVDAVFNAVAEFRGSTPANDDMTVVALKMTP